MRIGMPELLIILAIVIVLFGARRLPELGSGIAKGIKGFRKGKVPPAVVAARVPDGRGGERGPVLR